MVTKCYICKNTFSSINLYVKMMQDTSLGYEFSTFTVGAILKQSTIERDDKLRSKFHLRGVDGIKTAITKELGKKFVRKTKKRIDHLSPDITFTINFKTEQCNVKTKPIFLYGRYIKEKRGLSQKEESCKDCKSRGCIFCNNHGIVSFDGVEGKVAKFLYEKFKTEQVKFTWIGGEDKTSLVMGDGRPFFVKLVSPKKRNIKLTKKSNLNEITIRDLRKIDYIPSGSIHFKSKTKILVSTKNNVLSNKLKNLKYLVNIPIEITDSNRQYKKTIYNLKYKKHSLQAFVVEIEADGGIPIKRFVDGSDIIPNISSVIGMQCSCKKFDINQIYLSK
jgi:tRNA pseudouridine synthase 10|tara:strand:- start:10 stop:1008 length:999 start_codon:yes stop_codon:yes gene_type:complete